MATTLAVATKFTAIDRYTGVVRKMEKSTSSFTDKATAGFAKLGAAIGALAIGNTIVQENLKAEKAFASLSAITGVSGAAFDEFRKQVDKSAKQTNMLVGDMAKAFEIIGSQKPELLANAKAMGVVTEAAVTLSRASNEDLAVSAANLTGIMNQFDLAAGQSSRTINALAAGTVAGAASIMETSEALKNVGTVAKMSNMSLEQTVAALQMLSLKKITGAEAGTKLRGVLIKLKDAGVGYASGQFDINDALMEAQSRFAKLKTAKEKDALASKIFGMENINTGLIMMDSIDKINSMTKAVTGTESAYEMAAKNTSTLAFMLESAKNKFFNFFTVTTSTNKALNGTKDVLRFVIDNMGGIIQVLLVGVGLWIAYKAALIGVQAWLFSYNIVLGITTALHGKSAFFVHGNTVAYAAYRAAVVTTTAAQWLFAAAVNAGLVKILAIAAIIGFLVALVANLIKHWDKISKAFKDGGIIDGIKMIGKVFLDTLLMPVQGLLSLLSKIPGMSKLIQPALDKVQSWRIDQSSTSSPLNPEAATASATQRIEKTNNSKVEVRVKADAGTEASLMGGMKNIDAKVSNTYQWKR